MAASTKIKANGIVDSYRFLADEILARAEQQVKEANTRKAGRREFVREMTAIMAVSIAAVVLILMQMSRPGG